MCEVWRQVVGYEGLYDVSNLGNIRTYWKLINDGCFTRWEVSSVPIKFVHKVQIPEGYETVSLRARNRKITSVYVHRVVLEAFVTKRQPGQVCRHLNGKPYDNRLENITWGTPKENAQDRKGHGNQSNRKLSNRDMVLLRHRALHGKPVVNLAFDYGITYREALRICHGTRGLDKTNVLTRKRSASRA